MKTTKKLRNILGVALLFVVMMLMVVPVYAKSGPRISCKKYRIETGHVLLLEVSGKGDSKATWTSSNKKVATVSKKGMVTAKKPGKAAIKAKVGGKTLKCALTVKPKSYSGYTWNGKRIEDLSFKALQRIYYDISSKYSGEVPVGATDKEWAIIRLYGKLVEERNGIVN